MWFGVLAEAQTTTPQNESEGSVANANGYGSTGVYARTFATTVASMGSDISYTSDATNGDYFTINHTGVYAVTYSDGNPNGDNDGISLNFAATTTWSSAWRSGNELCNFTVANTGASCSVTVLLDSGDVLRAHRVSNSAGAN